LEELRLEQAQELILVLVERVLVWVLEVGFESWSG
jgi:hypothetical protein